MITQKVPLIEPGTILYRALNTFELDDLISNGCSFLNFNHTLPRDSHTLGQWINCKVEYKKMDNLSSWTPNYSIALAMVGKEKEGVSRTSGTVVQCRVPTNGDEFIFMDVTKFLFFALDQSKINAKRLSEVHLSGRGKLDVTVVSYEGRQLLPMDLFITAWDGNLTSVNTVGFSGISTLDKEDLMVELQLLGIKINQTNFNVLVSSNSHRTAKIQTAEKKKLPIVSLEMIRSAIRQVCSIEVFSRYPIQHFPEKQLTLDYFFNETHN
jgi:hypothetical protein